MATFAKAILQVQRAHVAAPEALSQLTATCYRISWPVRLKCRRARQMSATTVSSCHMTWPIKLRWECGGLVRGSSGAHCGAVSEQRKAEEAAGMPHAAGRGRGGGRRNAPYVLTGHAPGWRLQLQEAALQEWQQRLDATQAELGAATGELSLAQQRQVGACGLWRGSKAKAAAGSCSCSGGLAAVLSALPWPAQVPSAPPCHPTAPPHCSRPDMSARPPALPPSLP